MISTSFRVALSALLFAGALGLASTGPVQAQSIMKQCGDDWKAAKANNTTNGMKWPEFLKQCRVQKEGAAAPAAAPAPVPVSAPAPAPIAPAPVQTYRRSRSPCRRLARPAPANSPRRRKPGAAAAAARWSGSTPRASPIPTITRAAVGTARRSRAPTCARLTLAPPATTPRRARRNSRSRCSRRSSGRRAEFARARLSPRRCARSNIKDVRGTGQSSTAMARAIGGYFSSRAMRDANPGRARSRPIERNGADCRNRGHEPRRGARAGLLRHRDGAREVSVPVRRQHRRVQTAQVRKIVARSDGPVARQRVKTDRARLALDQHGIDLEPGEVGRLGADRLAADDVDLEDLARAFETRGDVHFVADRRIVEPAQRTQVADAAFARIEPDAETHRLERALLGLSAAAPALVQRDQRLAHVQRRFDRVRRMFRIVERRVPERHDGVAHIFVDRAFPVEHGVGHRRQIFVEEMGELRRVEPLRDGRKRADVAEQQRQFALQAAELERSGISARRDTTAGETNRPKAERISRS